MNSLKLSIHEIDALSPILRKHREAKERIVFTNGVFDLVHAGHIGYLRAAKEQGDVLVVALNSDASVKRLKGPLRPILPLRERAKIIAAMEMVDHVTWFDEETPLNIIMRVKPDVLVKGGDYKAEDVVGRDFVEENGGRVCVLNFVEGQSSSNIIERILESAKRR